MIAPSMTLRSVDIVAWLTCMYAATGIELKLKLNLKHCVDRKMAGQWRPHRRWSFPHPLMSGVGRVLHERTCDIICAAALTKSRMSRPVHALLLDRLAVVDVNRLPALCQALVWEWCLCVVERDRTRWPVLKFNCPYGQYDVLVLCKIAVNVSF